MKKYGSPEKIGTVFAGEEVKILNDAFEKTGKTAVSDFTEDELEDLWKALDRKEEPKKSKKTEKTEE